MSILKSKFKKSGTYGILVFLNISIAALMPVLLFWTVSDYIPDSTTILIAALTLISIQIILLLLFFNHCKIITINQDGISFGNPVFMYLSKSYAWSDFDHFILVSEETEHSEIEAIWLMKNKTLVKRISSGIYLNYEDLRTGLKIKSEGHKTISPALQARAVLGMKVTL